MTQEELKRAEQGFSILNEINDIKQYIERIKKDTIPLSLNFLDDDIKNEAISKQIARYENKIKELQKRFDEL